MALNSDRIFEMLAKDLAGQLTLPEKASLDAWRAESKANERLYQSCLTTWQELDPGTAPDIFDEKAGWTDLKQRLHHGSQVQPAKAFPTKSKATRQQPLRWQRGALALVALVLLGFLGLFLTQRGPFAAKMQWVRTQPGELAQVELPDGSLVELNGGSGLGWHKDYGRENRQVQFEGQAFFKVVSQQKPFSVRTAHAEVRVLGTQFDVWARLQKTKVSVTEGRVAVSVIQTGEATTLLANQSVAVLGQRLGALQSIDVTEGPDWMRRRLVFKADLLEDVIADLESWFTTSIQLANPSLGSLQVTGSFQNPTLETVLSEVAIALNLNYEQTRNGYRLSRK